MGTSPNTKPLGREIFAGTLFGVLIAPSLCFTQAGPGSATFPERIQRFGASVELVQFADETFQSENWKWHLVLPMLPGDGLGLLCWGACNRMEIRDCPETPRGAQERFQLRRPIR